MLPESLHSESGLRTEAPQALPEVAALPVSRTQVALERHVPGYKGGPVRRTVALVAAPWTWPTRLLSRSVLDLVDTTASAAMSVPQELAKETKRQGDAWDSWTPAERSSVLRQACTWGVILALGIAGLLLLPLAGKAVAAVLVTAGWYGRSRWDLARWVLDLPQLPDLAQEETEAVVDAELVEPAPEVAPQELTEALLIEPAQQKVEEAL